MARDATYVKFLMLSNSVGSKATLEKLFPCNLMLYGRIFVIF